MSNTPKKEQPNTDFVQDRSNTDEVTRLQLQDRMLTSGMGGILSEQPDPSRFQRVLDVGCGTGGWLIEVAKTYPSATRLIGIDVNSKLLDAARAEAKAQQVDDRVEFRIMDALRMLEFPEQSFDLINQRLGVSYLRTWDWPKLLSEYRRVGRRGATIRVTESDIADANTPAFTQLSSLFLKAMAQAGNFAIPENNSTLVRLPSFLSTAGIEQVQVRSYSFTYRPGTPEGDFYIEDMKHFFRNIVPFLRKWTRVLENYDELYQQMLIEMKQSDFEGRWNFLTVWGLNPMKKWARPDEID